MGSGAPGKTARDNAHAVRTGQYEGPQIDMAGRHAAIGGSGAGGERQRGLGKTAF